MGLGVCHQPAAGRGHAGPAAPQRLLPRIGRAVLPRSQGRSGGQEAGLQESAKRPIERGRSLGKITPFTGPFEMPFGAPPSGRYMPTPGGRTTTTLDSAVGAPVQEQLAQPAGGAFHDRQVQRPSPADGVLRTSLHSRARGLGKSGAGASSPPSRSAWRGVPAALAAACRITRVCRPMLRPGISPAGHLQHPAMLSRRGRRLTPGSSRHTLW